MKYLKAEYVFCVIIVAICVVTLYNIYMESKSCTESGGNLVRGIVWFKCIK